MADQPTRPRPRLPFALPTSHIMGLAPLDCWLRLLAVSLARPIRPKYWLRLGWCLAGALVGTGMTVHERLVLLPVRLIKFGKGKPFNHPPGVLAVLGYYRSGTTHLHYLLSCDRRFITPEWRHTIAPQGFLMSWWVLKWALVPFLGNRRPQDDVAFGPQWPAEDDFAMCNWVLASSLPGRFVLPSQHERFQKWHYLEGLSERQLARFRHFLAFFCWKLTRAAPSKRLLLKSPTHTARLAELRRVFDDNIKFIHITRDPEAVIRSNARMYERLSAHALEDLPPLDEVRRRIVDEYRKSEDKFLAEAAELGPDRLARIRYQDLIADPRGELKRAYDQLGLGWTDELDSQITRYLHAVADYRTASDAKGTGHPVIADPAQDEPEVCSHLRRAFDHARPTIEPVELPPSEAAPSGRSRQTWAWISVPITAMACLALWLTLAWATSNRYDSTVWLYGVAIGVVAIRLSGRGSVGLGLWAMGWFLAIVAASVYPMPEITRGYTGIHRVKSILSDYGVVSNTYLWLAMGALSAYRYASREHLRPPGK